MPKKNKENLQEGPTEEEVMIARARQDERERAGKIVKKYKDLIEKPSNIDKYAKEYAKTYLNKIIKELKEKKE